MRSIKFYISVFMVIGLISLNSFSFAGERYNIDVESVKKAAQNSLFDGEAVIKWDAKIKNNTDANQTYEVKVNFLNSDNETIVETARLVTFDPGEAKVVTHVMNIETTKVKGIDSGYATVSKVNEQTLAARLDKNMNVNISPLSDDSVSLAYTVKLKNNTDKSMTRKVTVAFLDSNNRQVRSETMQASFNAGESKTITDTLKVSAFDADRISIGHVTLN